MCKRVRSVGMVVTVLGALAWSGEAKADCFWANTVPPALECFSPWGNDTVVKAEIGSDSDWGSQWIRWTNLETPGCWWDYLCWDTNTNDWCATDPGKLIHNVFVHGPSFERDYIDILSGGDVSGCSYNLTAPVCDGHSIDVEGGSDDPLNYGSEISQSSACRGKMFGSWGNDYIWSERPDANIFSDIGDDTVSLFANQSSLSHIVTDAGNDAIYDYGSGIALEESCGDGSGDFWYGPYLDVWSKPYDCECTFDGCN
jgi:hypothetical protein